MKFNPKAIFFDWDHTLWDHDRNAREVILDLVDEFNLTNTLEEDQNDIWNSFNVLNNQLWDDYQSKKRIRYHEMLNQILPISEIAQIFTLNNKIFVQIENDVKLFGSKNLKDNERLFEILKDDLINKKRGNFLFVKDIDTHQRKLLYDLLESKGYKRRELFRHYSY